MKCKRIVLAVVVATGFATINTGYGHSAEERWPHIFLSACVLKDFDPKLRASSYGVDKDQIFVYLLQVKPESHHEFQLLRLSKGPPTEFFGALFLEGESYQIEGLASVDFGPLTPNGGYEAMGGLLSRAIARDIVDYFETQPFRLVEDWKAYMVANTKTLPRCEIEFTRAKTYMDHIYRPKEKK